MGYPSKLKVAISQIINLIVSYCFEGKFNESFNSKLFNCKINLFKPNDFKYTKSVIRYK